MTKSYGESGKQQILPRPKDLPAGGREKYRGIYQRLVERVYEGGLIRWWI
jgi:hypothetical protein